MLSYCVFITHSHGRRECCKDDRLRQWGRAKVDSPPTPSPLTDRHHNLHHKWLRRGYLPFCDISSSSVHGFRFCACANSRTKLFTRQFFLFFCSSNCLQPRRQHRFWYKIRQKTRFRARMCLLGLQNQNFNSRPLFSPKLPFWGPFWTGIYWNFRHTRLLMTLNHHRSPVKVVQWIGKVES